MAVDRFKAMEVFNRVVEIGSFSGAATALQLPKGRVTTIVQELEAHLGVKLLNRTTRRLSLTDDGAVFHQRALVMEQEMAELESDMRRAVSKPAGRLRVDVPASLGRHVIGPALGEFFERYPGIVLELGSTDRPVDLIAEGVDCVIRGGPVHDEMLVSRPLGHLPVVTCATPGYLARHGTPQTIEDLQQHCFVNFFSAKTLRVFPFDFSRDGQLHQVNRPHQVSTNDAETYLSAGLAGLGLMQLPYNRLLHEHVRAGRLQLVLKAWSGGALPIAVLYPRNRHLTAKVRAFADWAGEVFKREYGAELLAALAQALATPDELAAETVE